MICDYILTSPLKIPYTSKKEFSLNMNTYRNTHFQCLNKVKIKYKEEMKDQIMELPVFNHIDCIEYTMYYPDKRKRDGMNVASVISKFFLDALTEYGIIEDDNVNIVRSEAWKFGGVDNKSPRCEIKITGDVREL